MESVISTYINTYFSHTVLWCPYSITINMCSFWSSTSYYYAIWCSPLNQCYLIVPSLFLCYLIFDSFPHLRGIVASWFQNQITSTAGVGVAGDELLNAPGSGAVGKYGDLIEQKWRKMWDFHGFPWDCCRQSMSKLTHKHSVKLNVGFGIQR